MMTETTCSLHRLFYSIASADTIIRDLPDHKIESDDHQLRLKSFVFLCHAALEEYIESLSIEILNYSIRAYQTDQTMTYALSSALAFYGVRSELILDRLPSAPRTARDFWLGACQVVRELHKTAIFGINGIKTGDQDAAFLPLGIKVHSYDHLLSQALNSYGTTRGSFAHLFSAKTILPKAGVLSEIRNISRLIVPFDQMVGSSRHNVML